MSGCGYEHNFFKSEKLESGNKDYNTLQLHYNADDGSHVINLRYTWTALYGSSSLVNRVHMCIPQHDMEAITTKDKKHE